MKHVFQIFAVFRLIRQTGLCYAFDLRSLSDLGHRSSIAKVSFIASRVHLFTEERSFILLSIKYMIFTYLLLYLSSQAGQWRSWLATISESISAFPIGWGFLKKLWELTTEAGCHGWNQTRNSYGFPTKRCWLCFRRATHGIQSL